MPKETFFNLADDKRAKILDVALDEFADNDYVNASISRIVARAGIAKGSFYQYFEDKEDLYVFLVGQIAEKKAEMFSLDHPDPEHVGLFNYMRWIFRQSVEFELTNPRYSRMGYRMLKGGASENKVFRAAMDNAIAYYRNLIALGKAQGDIAPDIDDELAAEVFWLVLSEMGQRILRRINEQHGTEWHGRKAAFDFPETQALYAQLLRILEFGLGNHPFGIEPMTVRANPATTQSEEGA